MGKIVHSPQSIVHSLNLLLILGLLGLFALLAQGQAQAGTWYVDNAATGANNGTSWQDAWHSFSDIQWVHSWETAKVGVKGGDTLYISGGTESKVYNETLTVAYTIGATLTKRLLISAGQDPGHNGKVIIDGGHIRTEGVDWRASQYVTLSGNYNGQIHLILRNFTHPTSRLLGAGVETSGSDITGCIAEYIEVADSNNGINARGEQNIVRNCYLHGVMGDGAVRFTGYGNAYDSNSVHDCRIQLNAAEYTGAGPDGIQGGNGVTVYNNYIYAETGEIKGTVVDGVPYYQHQDGIQPLGSYWKIFNNTILNMGNSAIESGSIAFGFTETSGPAHEYGHYMFYNNIVAITKPSDPAVNWWTRGVEWLGKPGITKASDFFIAHNIFVDIYKYGAIRFDFDYYNLANPPVEDVYIYNNLIYNSGYNLYNPAISLNHAGSFTNVNIDYNAINKGMHGDDHIYLNRPPGGVPLAQAHPSNAVPNFVSYAERSMTNDFHLTAADTAARDAGLDLTSFVASFGIEAKDKDGIARPQGPAWDIGAYEYSENTYYVDRENGSDAHDGESVASAWKTVAKVNSSSFRPGDKILFKRGNLWRESLIVSTSGTAAAPIYLGAYGFGERPVLSGSDDYSWPGYRWARSHQPHEWYLQAQGGGSPGIAEPGGVWINGVYQFNGYYNGSWRLHQIGALTANSWQWGDGDSLGYHTIYIYSSVDPNQSGISIEGSQRPFCLSITNRDYIIIDNLEMLQSGRRNVVNPILYPYQAHHITVRNCKIHDASGGAGAIYVMRAHDFTLENSEVFNSFDPDGNGYGSLIYFESGASGTCDNITIKNNKIYGSYARDADLVGAVGVWSGGVAYGPKNCLIEHNEFFGPAQNAVYFRSGADNNIIRNNYIHDIKGHQLNGGIAVQLRDHANNSLVYNNIVLNAYGPAMQSDGKNGGPGSADPSCTGNKFFNNVIYNGAYPRANGFHFFGANRDLEARNNIVVSHSGDLICVGFSDDSTYRGIALSNNRYYKTTATGQEFVFRGVNYETLEAMKQAMAASGYPNEENSVYGDPLFINTAPVERDHLRLSGVSACIDRGRTLTYFNTDIAGILRPQGAAWDIGAYEYMEGGGQVVYGDVSGDGDVSAYDAALTAQAAVGLITLTPEQVTRADVSGDGSVSAYDAASIAQYAVGLISSFPRN